MNQEELTQELERVKTQRDILAKQLNEMRQVAMMESPPEPQDVKALVSARGSASSSLLAKCEHCGMEQPYMSTDWPKNWIQSGTSAHGTKYQKAGIAWWCPRCK